MNCTVDDLGLRRHPKGEARAEWILFVHGMWEAGGVFDGIWGEEQIFPPFIRPFLEAGYGCAVQILPGYAGGLSVSARGEVSFYTYLASVRRSYEALGKPIVIGHSLGGLLTQKLVEEVKPPAAVLLAPAAPKKIFALRSLRLLCFAIKYAPEILGNRPLLPTRSDMDCVMLNGLAEKDRAKLYDKLQEASGLQAREISMPIGGGIPVRVDRDVPVCVAFGGKDRITPTGIAKALVTKYEAKPLPYRDKAHMLTLEPGWEKVANDVLDWLEGTVNRKGPHA